MSVHAAFVRKERDEAGAQTAHVRRQRNQALLAELELPDPFDLTTFTDQVARRRGRPIQLVAVEGAVANGSPCGWWCPTRDFDLIFLDGAASATHREHIVLHEVGHMLWGHDPALTTLAPILKRATSHLRWDSAAITGMLGRSGYDSPREQEAEVFATLAGLRIVRARGTHRGQVRAKVQLLSDALYPQGRA